MKNIYIAFIATFFAGCAVEIGNPGHPDDEKKKEVSVLAMAHVNQVIDISSEKDNSSGSEPTALALTDDGSSNTKSCNANNNEITTKSSLNKTDEVLWPSADPKWKIDLVRTQSSDVVWTSESDNVLSCSSENVTTIQFSNLKTLKIVKQNVQEYIRTETRLQDNSVYKNEKGKRSGTINTLMTKVSDDTEKFVLETKSSLNISLELTIEKEGQERTELKSEMKTPENDSIQVQKTYDRSTKKFNKIEIINASVLSKTADDRMVKTSFNNLIIDENQNCLPLSGSIEGKIFGEDGDLTGDPVLSYIIKISAKEANIEYSDGGLEEVSFDGCSTF